MRDAVRAVAPDAEVFGPEICLSLQWYAAYEDDKPNTCRRNFTTLRNPVNYDTLPNYAEVFDSPAYSFYELACECMSVNHAPSHLPNRSSCYLFCLLQIWALLTTPQNEAVTPQRLLPS
jgi:hypothetical protein